VPIIKFHPAANDELDDLLDSENNLEKLAGEQILVLLDLVQSNSLIRDRLLEHNRQLWVRQNGHTHAVDIKVIRQLESIANDGKYLTDAVRRLRDLSNKPVDRYRLFFAPAGDNYGKQTITILGIFHRDVAYTPETLEELKRRYEEEEK